MDLHTSNFCPALHPEVTVMSFLEFTACRLYQGANVWQNYFLFFKLAALILSFTDFHPHTTKQHCPSFMGPVILGIISISINYDTLKETGNTDAFTWCHVF
jgi:hypothetical protein